MTMETMVDLILNVILFLVLVVTPWLFQVFLVLCAVVFLLDLMRR